MTLQWAAALLAPSLPDLRFLDERAGDRRKRSLGSELPDCHAG